MKILVFSIIATVLALPSPAQDKPAYKLYSSSGEEIPYSLMIESMRDADLVFLGELHNDPIVHWMQLEITRDLYDVHGSSLVLGAEMFERDNQLLLDEYRSGIITEKKFEDEARLWPNYKTDYRPLLRFAREKKLKFVATNIPRRYANLVFRKGFEGLDSLSAEAKELMAPLPIHYDPDLPGYRAMLQMGGPSHGMGNMKNLPKAQAMKDATMAHFILTNKKPGEIFLHYNGAYHSENKEGIIYYIRRHEPDLTIQTLSNVMQDDLSTLAEAHRGKADFILVVPKTMTKTH